LFFDTGQLSYTWSQGNLPITSCFKQDYRRNVTSAARQLSERPRGMFHVTEYFAKSLKITPLSRGVCVPISIPLYVCTSYCLGFWDTQRQIIAWPWNTIQGHAFRAIENCTIRKFRYGFLFALHNNYGPILYHFRDIKARYWSKIRIFNIAITFGMEN